MWTAVRRDAFERACAWWESDGRRAHMKIGITCYPTYGGSGAVATELGIALAARGHDVHFITYQQPFRLPTFLPRVWFHEVDVGRYPLFEYPPYDLALAVRMHEVVRDRRLDILHCHYAIPHATSAWIAREMLREAGDDMRVLTTLHGTDITIVGQERRSTRSPGSPSRSRTPSRRSPNTCATRPTAPSDASAATCRSFTTSSIRGSTIAAGMCFPFPPRW